MQPVQPNNSRYILELEREALLKEQLNFAGKYGTFSFAFLSSLETFALLAYLVIIIAINSYKQTRTKTNFIVSLWSAINFLVLVEKLANNFYKIVTGDTNGLGQDTSAIFQMIAASGRCYGTSLIIVWFYTRYFNKPKPKYNYFLYFLTLFPALICLTYIIYFFVYNKFIYEVYGPACDIVNVVVYLSVIALLVPCSIFAKARNVSNYAFWLSLVNLVTNFPHCLMTIYVRFNLDISWTYRFHLYFVDFVLDVITCSSAFAALFFVILYNENVRRYLHERQDSFFHKVPVKA